MYDAIVQQTKGKVAPNLLAKLALDVGMFRQGLFYASMGGRAPGAGSGDTVPSMLTPGEFVIKKSAADAIGLENLHRLNNFDAFAAFSHFAAGGPVVLAASAARVTSSRSSVAAAGPAAPVTIEFNTEINNPVGENSVYAMNKLLQTKAATGAFDRLPQAVRSR